MSDLNDKNKAPNTSRDHIELSYSNETFVSTRESAAQLHVSLGTIQKMVEMGELIAWKTRGGHRRILLSSLQANLNQRHELFRQTTCRKCTLLGIFKRTENISLMEEIIESISIDIELQSTLDISDALMQAVEVKPDVIYLDSILAPVEQLHLIHYLSRNFITQRIPLLVDEGFTALHPGVIRLAAENSGLLKPFQSQGGSSIDPEETFKHPLILGYPGTCNLSSPTNPEDFEDIIKDALIRKLI
ncbi:MAG: excisionase family DNA-binding protein [Betaproteobacteria bacterium]|jgi:excisionase family DNA binding protein